MKKYYKFFIIIILFFAVVTLFFASYRPALAPENTESVFRELKINGKIINVEIADTVEKRTKGLSGRQSLPENQGMLFVFATPDYYSFWMKDMNFGLDFIWIRGNEVVEITENVSPEDYQPASSLDQRESGRATQSNRGEPSGTLAPKNKTDKVLEVNAGTAKKLGIETGNNIKF